MPDDGGTHKNDGLIGLRIDFRDRCTQRMGELGWSIRSFAGRVGLNPTYVSQILRGERRPPLAHLDLWADVFNLQDAEREAFILSGALMHTPQCVRDILERVHSQEGGEN